MTHGGLSWLGVLLCFSVACSSGASPPSKVGDSSGQTGSMGACECASDAQCAAPINDYIAYLSMPAKRPSRIVGSQCVARGPGDFAAHGTVCHCEQAFGDSDVASPQSDLLLGYRTGCDVAGRSGDCLYGCSEFPGCDPGDATSCQALCADLDARLDADAERTFDAALRSAVCTTDGACGCRSVFRVEDHCYAGQAKLDTPYDCALTDEAILAQAFSASGGGVAGSSGTATQVDPNAPDQCD